MKTAVEWFYDEIKHIIPNDYLKKYEQAKDLEMKNLAQAFEDGEHNYFYSKKTGEDFESGIEYYNEKFKKVGECITVPNLVIDLGEAQLTFKKSDITSKELVDVYMTLESYIEENFKHIYLK